MSDAPAILHHAAETGWPRPRQARLVVFDSGLGGLTVLSEVLALAGGADILFAADDAVFPYGRLTEAALIERVLAVVAVLFERHRPDIVIIACHTAATLVLPPLRARWPQIAFVGTVPAIKPAAALSRSKAISVLATPGTVAREYTRDLVRSFAGDCTVTLVGSVRLAPMAEAAMRGERIADADLSAEIAPAFVVAGDRRTDAIVLACTHYPLLLDRFVRLAPWPVNWIDPAPAIARRVGQVLVERGLGPQQGSGAEVRAVFTSGTRPGAALQAFLLGRHVGWTGCEPF